jgi:hypothetical protein
MMPAGLIFSKGLQESIGQAATLTCASSHFFAREIIALESLGQSCSVAGAKSAPFGQTSV